MTAPAQAFDWMSKLRHLLQTLAFCFVIASLQYAFSPQRPYLPALAYSVCIGTITWAVIDFGRHGFASSRATGWPSGPAGIVLVLAGILAGWLLGSALGDLACRSFGWYTLAGPMSAADATAQTRNGILVTVMAGVVGSYYFYAASRRSWLEQQMAQARQQAAEARLKLLETQLEPHMLFNTLANLRVLIGTDPAAAQQMLDRMNDYLRATLSASRSTHHALSAEFDRLRDYLELMKVRMGERLRFSLLLPPELARHPVPTLLLQPLVENAIRHGIEPSVRGGEVRVQALAEAGALVLRVTDTGVGLDDAALQRLGAVQAGGPMAHELPPAAGGGFGLLQVRERLATAYGEAAQLVLPAGHGTAATDHGMDHGTAATDHGTATTAHPPTCIEIRLPLGTA